MSYFTTNINYINNSFLEIITNNSSVDDLLYQNFTFDVPNAKFMPSFRSGRWDGKIHMYDKRTKRIYQGLHNEVKSLLESSDIGDVTIENFKEPRNISDLFDKWLEKIKDTLPWYPYDYQIASAKEALNNQKQLILSPTSSGKSFIFFLMAKFLIDFPDLGGDKILFLVPSSLLRDQIIDDLTEYGLDPKLMHKIAGKKSKEEMPANAKFIVSTWQGAYKEPGSFFHKFSSVFVDEVHTATGESLKGILEKCTKTKYKVGMSGTLRDSKIDELVLRGLFGPVYIAITTKEMIGRKIAAKTKIFMTRLSYDKVKDNEVFTKKMDYAEQVKMMTSLKNRDDVVCKLIGMHPDENIIILYRHKKHGKRMQERAKELFPDREVFRIDGDMKVEDRMVIKKYIDTQTEKRGVVLFATFGTLSTGISIKNLDIGIIAAPVKSCVTVLQSLGRLMRISPTKMFATIYDLWDDFPFKYGKNYARDHAEYRLEKYDEAGHETDEMDMNFNGK